MRTLIFLAILAVLSLPLAAQTQEGSVEIAKSIPSGDDASVADFTTCVERLNKSGASADKAIDACTKIASIVAKRATKIANEAADATKASRPVVVADPYWGGSRYGYSGRWNYFQPSYRSRMRPARPLAPNKPLRPFPN